jgi:hypothetical protein
MPLRKFVLTIWAAEYDFESPPDHDKLLRDLAEEIEEGRAELVLIQCVSTPRPQDDPDYRPHVGVNLARWMDKVWN